MERKWEQHILIYIVKYNLSDYCIIYHYFSLLWKTNQMKI